MRRPLLVLAVVLPLAVVPATTAQAEVTCNGEVATIIGIGGERVDGTDGDDVIVAGGFVAAGAGDDTVCSSGSDVSAGTGDDWVSFDETEDVHRVLLGRGDDTFVGTSGRDVVVDANDLGSPVDEDLGDDTITTFGGDDLVGAGSSRGGPQADRVDLGAGDDVLLVRDSGLTSAAVLRGGPGHDQIALQTFNGRRWPVLLDLQRLQFVRRDRVRAAGWQGFETYVASGRNQERVEVTVRGTAGPDDVTVEEAGRLRVYLGRGDDRLAYVTFAEQVRGTVAGGRGRDLLGLRAFYGRSVVDLAAGTAFVAGAGRRDRLSVRGFADVSGRRLLVRGDTSANAISVGCGGVVSGGGGADVLRAVGADDASARCGRTNGVRLVGGRGDDLILGSTGDDLLVGGAGVDRADGRGGRDECDAEVLTGC